MSENSALLAAPHAQPALPAQPTHAAIFTSLQSLVGAWQGRTASGRLLSVRYSLHANQSVLMEMWQLDTSDALTLYHMDHATLMATHYCPLCNQPKLVLSPTTVTLNGTHQFAFVSATHLIDLTHEHQHAFELRLLSEQRLWRSETYSGHDGLSTEGVVYQRMINH